MQSKNAVDKKAGAHAAVNSDLANETGGAAYER
jgi:hypothetical protein